MQRQLQLRIEAQGKYLKKIIEEQQRISGVLSEAPGSGASAPQTDDVCPESDNKTDPTTPPPTSESPFVEPANEHASAKSFSLDESLSSHHEPQTPDSGCHASSPVQSPNGRPVKRKCKSNDALFTKQEIASSHSILESSLNSPYQQPHPLLLPSEQFDHSSELPTSDEYQLRKLSGDM